MGPAYFAAAGLAALFFAAPPLAAVFDSSENTVTGRFTPEEVAAFSRDMEPALTERGAT